LAIAYGQATNNYAVDTCHAAITQTNAVIVYNASDYLSANDTVLHIDYDLNSNYNLIYIKHSRIKYIL
jgi:hypothetical protein